jgi:hypothetical protein
VGGVPSHYTVDLDLVSPVDLTGIPTSFDITSLPKIQIGLDPITVNPITVNPLDVSVRVKEAPSIRAHVPAHYTVGFSLLGLQLARIEVCGETQVITEPYVANPCERCEETAVVAQRLRAIGAEAEVEMATPTRGTQPRSRARKR